MLAAARAQRALIVDAKPDVESEPGLGGTSKDIPTGQTISDDEDEPENSEEGRRPPVAKSKPAKRQANVPASTDKN